MTSTPTTLMIAPTTAAEGPVPAAAILTGATDVGPAGPVQTDGAADAAMTGPAGGALEGGTSGAGSGGEASPLGGAAG
jgi:hypothetical protein